MSTAALPELDNTIPPWPGEYVHVNGVRLHVRRTPGPPGGPAAVYVHGLGGSSTNWTDLSQQLSTTVNGYAVDLPGFGRTEPPADWTFTPDTQAAGVISFIEQLDSGPVHLLGNSLGGLTTILVAARRPDLVRTLTLISPAVPDLRPDTRRLSEPRLPLAFLPVIGRRVRKQLATLTPRDRAMQLVRLCFADVDAVPEHRIAEAEAEASERAGMPWAGASLGQAAVGMFRTWARFGAASVWRILRTVPVPTLVIWGTHDRLVTVRKAPRTVRALRHGRLLVLRETGHVAQMEHPITVARAVLGMWESVRDNTW